MLIHKAMKGRDDKDTLYVIKNYFYEKKIKLTTCGIWFGLSEGEIIQDPIYQPLRSGSIWHKVNF